MARRTITLPDDIDQATQRAGLGVSALARRAICDELDRSQRMDALVVWLDALDDEQGAPSAEALECAQVWVAGRRGEEL